jgi:hypothetical protein
MSFSVGEEIVCIIGGKLADSSPHLAVFPVKGETYHVRGLQMSPYKAMTGQCGVLLAEIQNDINPNTGQEWDYFSRRFRKVVKQKNKASITVFQKILDKLPKTPVKVPEKVE